MKPQVPKLSPEEAQATIKAFQSLAPDRKKVIAQLMKHPCAYCEKEFKTSNVGWSHGICQRHRDEQYAMMKKTPPPYKGNTVDLKTLTPDEIKLAQALFAIVKSKRQSPKA